MLKRIVLGDFAGQGRWTVGRVLFLLAVYLALPLGLAHAYLVWRVQQAAEIAFAPFRERASVSWARAFYTLRGEFGLEDLRIQPEDEGLGPVRARRLWVESPGWRWTLDALHADVPGAEGLGLPARRFVAPDSAYSEPSAAPPWRPFPAARRLGLRMQGLEVGFAGFLPSGLDDFGWVSAALFEAEGCVGALRWDAEQVRAMGLGYSASDFAWEYRVTGADEVLELTRLGAAGIGSVEIARTVRSPVPQDYLFTGGRGETLLSERHTLRDEGFIAARNRYCAERDGISLPVFLQRHIASVERLLAAAGLAAAPELRSAYQRFARDGGELTLEAQPAPAAHDESLALVERLQRYRASVRRDTAAPVAFRFESVPVQPIPVDFEGGSFDLLQLEAGTAATSTQDASLDASLPAPAPEGGAALAPGETDSVLDPAGLLRRGRPHLFAERAVEPAAETGGVPGDPAIAVTAAPEPTTAASNELSFEQLQDRIGRIVKLTLADGRTRMGRVESINESGLRLHVKLPSGFASYDIRREHILRIQAMD